MDNANALTTPFNFWFCKTPGLAIPQICLQYHDVKCDIGLGKLWYKSRKYTNFVIKCDKNICIDDQFINLYEYLSHLF